MHRGAIDGTFIETDRCRVPRRITGNGTLVQILPTSVGALSEADAGEMRSEYLPDSCHRVVRLSDVLEFQARRDRRRAGRRRVADAVDDAELPY